MVQQRSGGLGDGGHSIHIANASRGSSLLRCGVMEPCAPEALAAALQHCRMLQELALVQRRRCCLIQGALPSLQAVLHVLSQRQHKRLLLQAGYHWLHRLVHAVLPGEHILPPQLVNRATRVGGRCSLLLRQQRLQKHLLG